MGELREYTVVVNGHTTVMNLTPDDAARLSGTPVDEPVKAHSPANKAKTPANKDTTEQ